MRRSTCLLIAALAFSNSVAVWSQEQPPAAKITDGVYAVQRDSLKEKEVLPLKEGEVLVVHRHRYLKGAENEPPRFLVVRTAPAVTLELASEPKAVKEGDAGLRILLKLQPKSAASLERLTRDHEGGQIAIVVHGEVVTMHKVREVIKGGDVQITSCAAGAAEYLLGQLRAKWKGK